MLLAGAPLLLGQGAAPQACEDGKVRSDWKDLMVVRECTVPAPGGAPKTVTTTARAELKQEVTVFVRGLANFKDTSATPVDLRKLVLFLDRKPVKGARVLLPGNGESSLRFMLARGEDDRESWHSLLGSAIRDHKVTLSVGFEGQSPIATEVDDFQLVAIPGQWLALWIGLCVLLLVMLFWAARKSNILRDGTKTPPAGAKNPYSLARTQMAVWFVVVLAAYMFIWLVTGELDSLTPTVIGLMGISAATAVAGTTIGAGKAAVAAAEAKEQPATPAPPAVASVGFFEDILSDQNGLSLARMQIAAWTMILAIIFIRSVYQDLTMPQFDATLLGLMGISNGTYLGFKGLEK